MVIPVENNQIIPDSTKPACLTLEEIFENWGGELPEPYDWGALDLPTGKELL